MSPSKDVPILILRTWEHITTVQSDRDFADAMKFRILRWGEYPVLCRLTQCNPKGSYNGDLGGSKSAEREAITAEVSDGL